MNFLDKYFAIISTLDIASIGILCDHYSSTALFVHPFKTVRGRESIERQWKMMFKYCPNTTIEILDVQLVQDVCRSEWNHHFVINNKHVCIRGNSTMWLTDAKIHKQIDVFDKSFFLGLFYD